MSDDDTLSAFTPPRACALATAPVTAGIASGPYLLWALTDAMPAEDWLIGSWAGDCWMVGDEEVSPAAWSPLSLPPSPIERDLSTPETWMQTTISARPIDTAPIGGPDYFPPRTPGRTPLNCIFVWQPAHGCWPGGWRRGFWGGPLQRSWFDDDMIMLEPPPTHWAPMLAPPEEQHH
jgi:hypothetical protein